MDDFWGCRHALCQYGKRHGTYDGLEEISLDKVGVRVENHYFMYGDYVITIEESVREADSARSFSAWISEDSYSEVRQFVIGYRPLSEMGGEDHDYRQFIRDSVLQDNNIPRAIRKLNTKLRRLNEETWENDTREDEVYRLYAAIRDANGDVLGSYPVAVTDSEEKAGAIGELLRSHRLLPESAWNLYRVSPDAVVEYRAAKLTGEDVPEYWCGTDEKLIFSSCLFHDCDGGQADSDLYGIKADCRIDSASSRGTAAYVRGRELAADISSLMYVMSLYPIEMYAEFDSPEHTMSAGIRQIGPEEAPEAAEKLQNGIVLEITSSWRM
jgi:hypothetical protein